ncbi:penicillin acylase family protein [Henriciella aquimarina]|uniref:penicillin acylase family protein n=1 Tax=Henriciella aquimarina TaxID=545261 RepID=UPI0009FFEFE7|nr:penicillin acylase family protein [Henriciella aquimarina]
MLSTNKGRALSALLLASVSLAACTSPAPTRLDATPSPAPAEQTEKVETTSEILWDSYGVPHIYGETEEDVFYGYGWAQTHSHGNLLLRLYGEARGKGSEYWGADYEDTSTWLIANSVPQRAQEWYDRQTPQFQANLDAFAEGINDYVAENPGAIDDEVEVVLPITGVDVVAHAHRLMNYIYVASPSRTIGPSAPPAPAGSNTWAVAPSKSESGNSLLLQNPHLPWASGFFTYYEAHLNGPDFEMYGATQVGLPVIRFAFNQRMGISNTVNGTLGATSYLLTLDGDGYVFDGETLPFKTRDVTYKVRQEDGSVVEKTMHLRESVHGPVFERADGETIALRVAGLDRPGMLQQYFDMLRSDSYEEFKEVMARLQVPTFNITYADKEGHIQYTSNGILPKHETGDLEFWEGLVPGDTSEYVWDEIHPLSDLPIVADPPSGFVQNSNDAPWLATYPPVYEPEDFPPYVAELGPMSLRAQNSVSMMVNEEKVSFEEFVTLKKSSYATAADRVLPDLIEAAKDDPDPEIQEALTLLQNWDKEFDQDARGALLFEEFMLPFMAKPNSFPFAGQQNYETAWSLDTPLSTPEGVKDPEAALDMLRGAIDSTKEKYGSIDAEYGDFSRYQIGERDIAGLGGYGNLGAFNVITWFDPDGDNIRTPAHGETWIAMIEFSDPIKAYGLMTYGNSRQPGTTHYDDQVQMLADGEYRKLWLERDEVEANLERRVALDYQDDESSEP